MTISKKLQLTINPTSKEYVNSSWENLNPLYCANQQFLYVNAAATGDNITYAPRFINPGNPFSTTKYVIAYSSGDTSRIISLKLDYTANTISKVADITPATGQLKTATKISNNRIIFVRNVGAANPTTTVDLFSLDINSANGNIVKNTTLSYSFTSNNNLGAADSYINLSYLEENKAILSYFDFSNTSYGSLKVALLTTNTSGDITVSATSTVFTGPSAFYSSLSANGINLINKEGESNKILCYANATSVVYNPFSWAGANIAVGSATVYTPGNALFASNLVDSVFEFASNNYYFSYSSSILTEGRVILLSGNTISNSFYSNNTLAHATSRITPVKVLNNNKITYINYRSSPYGISTISTLDPYGSIFIASMNVDNTVETKISTITPFEINGNIFNSSGAYVLDNEGMIDALAGTTRGCILNLGYANTSSNAALLTYRFLDANPASTSIKYTLAGSNTYTVPSNGTVFVQAYSSGGIGWNGASGATSYGPGGGAFSYKSFAVSSGQTIPLVVGLSANSTVAGTNSSISSIVCTPGANATSGGVGAGGIASGGDLNANGSSGIAGTYTSDSGGKGGSVTTDTSQSGLCGKPGPTRTGSGILSTGQVYGSSKAVGVGIPLFAASLGTRPANGVIIITHKPG